MTSLLLPDPALYADWRSALNALNTQLQQLETTAANDSGATSLPIQDDQGRDIVTGGGVIVYAPDGSTPINGTLVEIDTQHLADAAVELNKLADDSVGETKLRVGAITANKAVIGEAAILTAMIADGQIVNAKIADADIEAAKINTVSAGSLIAGNITAGGIYVGADQAITLDGSTNTITADDALGNLRFKFGRFGVGDYGVQIVDAAGNVLVSATDSATRINADFITVGTLDASVVTVTNLSADSITSGNLSADFLSGGTIDASVIGVTNLNANNITTGTLAANLIGASQLSAITSNLGTITAGDISALSLSADQITAGTLTGREIRSASDVGTAGGIIIGSGNDTALQVVNPQGAIIAEFGQSSATSSGEQCWIGNALFADNLIGRSQITLANGAVLEYAGTPLTNATEWIRGVNTAQSIEGGSFRLDGQRWITASGADVRYWNEQGIGSHVFYDNRGSILMTLDDRFESGASNNSMRLWLGGSLKRVFVDANGFVRAT